MSQLICIDRQRDSRGKIIKYVLMKADTLDYIEVDADKIRSYLENKGTYITNLKLSRDGRILLKDDKFQKMIDRDNKIHANNKTIKIDVEAYVDAILSKIISYSKSSRCTSCTDMIKFGNINTKGDINTFTINVANSKVGYDNCVIILRYRKNILKHNNKDCDAAIDIDIVGVKTANNKVKFAEHDEITICNLHIRDGKQVNTINISD